MRTLSLGLLAAVALVLAYGVPNSALAENWRSTTESELRTFIAGKTRFSTTEKGNDFAMYYDPNGTYRGKITTRTRTLDFHGTWAIRDGNRVCLTPGSGPRAGTEVCRTYFTNGTLVRVIDGSGRTKRREAGNKLLAIQ